MALLNHLQGVPILVLDDDPDCLELLIFALGMEGAIVSAADCVAAAQTSFLAQPPQLVVSDLAMPGTTGYDFIAWLRALSPVAGGRASASASLNGDGKPS
ncbi:response regulator [Phormidium sp. FACHB-592]|uniref:Response regulator n=1 Tax=Stenomitos frigidus AS-A4 TaxID=2933935 RepID=A0ABV0KT04_9CYAN|nr:response regulator [Phormidium sp. FACHB-592]MBD2072423.1 response regulator [Phormidium sp. FACHB-592]